LAVPNINKIDPKLHKLMEHTPLEHKAHIEVATLPGTPAKEKGGLLEALAADLLRIQNYKERKDIHAPD
jgi:hypothetical protein